MVVGKEADPARPRGRAPDGAHGVGGRAPLPRGEGDAAVGLGRRPPAVAAARLRLLRALAADSGSLFVKPDRPDRNAGPATAGPTRSAAAPGPPAPGTRPGPSVPGGACAAATVLWFWCVFPRRQAASARSTPARGLAPSRRASHAGDACAATTTPGVACRSRARPVRARRRASVRAPTGSRVRRRRSRTPRADRRARRHGARVPGRCRWREALAAPAARR